MIYVDCFIIMFILSGLEILVRIMVKVCKPCLVSCSVLRAELGQLGTDLKIVETRSIGLGNVKQVVLDALGRS